MRQAKDARRRSGFAAPVGCRTLAFATDGKPATHASSIVPTLPQIKRIGVLTGGGDAPGLNAVIRAVVKSAFNAGIEVVGLEDSFDGLLDPARSRILTPGDVTGILRLGGTILGTTNHGNPFAYPVDTPEGTVD